MTQDTIIYLKRLALQMSNDSEIQKATKGMTQEQIKTFISAIIIDQMQQLKEKDVNLMYQYDENINLQKCFAENLYAKV